MKPTVYKTWILICDASSARVFEQAGKDKPWITMHELHHDRARGKRLDLMADRPGRVQESAGMGRRAAMEPHTDPKEVEAVRFAREIADMLERELERHAYSRLLVAAPPRFLGLLREQLSGTVQKALTYTVDRDYTWVAPHELPPLLGGLL